MDGLTKAYDSEGKPVINRQYVAGKIVHSQTFFGQAPGIDTPTAAAFAQRLDQSDQAFFQQIEPVVFDALKSDNRRGHHAAALNGHTHLSSVRHLPHVSYISHKAR